MRLKKTKKNTNNAPNAHKSFFWLFETGVPDEFDMKLNFSDAVEAQINLQISNFDRMFLCAENHLYIFNAANNQTGRIWSRYTIHIES